MAMSRRKQLHPKSLKGKDDQMIRKIYQKKIMFLLSSDGDESLFVLPDELKYDEEVSE